MKNRALLNILLMMIVMASFNTLSALEGPSQPEAMQFEPVDVTDLVQLSTGDFNYTIPVMTVPGPEGNYPVVLSYHAGIGMNQEPTWVGLGWTLNPGSVNRGVAGFPDDFMDDTFHSNFHVEATKGWSVGVGISYGPAGLDMNYDSHKGLSGDVSLKIGTMSISAGSSGLNANIGVGPVSMNMGTAGFSAQAQVGIGPMSMGLGYSKSGLSPSMSTGVGGLNLSMNRGGFSASYSGSKGGLSGSISYSSNGGLGGSIGASSGGWSLSGSKAGLSSVSIGGVSANMGYASSGGPGEFSSRSSSIEIPIPIPGGTLSLKHSSYVYYLDESNMERCYGYLHQNEYFTQANLDKHYLGNVAVYGSKFDRRKQKQILYSGQDSYMVSAQGLVGQFKPYSNNAIFYKDYTDKNLKGYIDYCDARYETDDQNEFGEMDSDDMIYVLKDTDLNSINMPYDYFNYTDSIWVKYEIYPAEHNLYSVNSGYNDYTWRFIGDKGTNMVTTTPNNITTSAPWGNGELPILSSRMNGSRIINPVFESDENSKTYGKIKGFTIIENDGKVYHFMQPVWEYFEYSYNEINGMRSYTTSKAPRATTWMLTAIEGPDYVDRGTEGYDEQDWGYWVKLDYEKTTNDSSLYAWRTPHEGYVEDEISEAKNMQFGVKDMLFLKSVETASHIARFVKSNVASRKTTKDYSDVIYRSHASNAGSLNGQDICTFDISGDWVNELNYLRTDNPTAQAIDIEVIFDYDIRYCIGEAYSHLHTVHSTQNLTVDASEIIDVSLVENGKLTRITIPRITSDYAGIQEFTAQTLQTLVATLSGIDGLFFIGNLNSVFELLGEILPDHFEARAIDKDVYGAINVAECMKHQFGDNYARKLDRIELFNKTQLVDGNYPLNRFEAIGAVDFTYSYDLCRQTPNAIDTQTNPGGGKLTLESVQTFGYNHEASMPPYEFKYTNTVPSVWDETYETLTTCNYSYNPDHYDIWGYYSTKDYHKPFTNDLDAAKKQVWSLRKIVTPMGAELTIEYESDDYMFVEDMPDFSNASSIELWPYIPRDMDPAEDNSNIYHNHVGNEPIETDSLFMSDFDQNFYKYEVSKYAFDKGIYLERQKIGYINSNTTDFEYHYSPGFGTEILDCSSISEHITDDYQQVYPEGSNEELLSKLIRPYSEIEYSYTRLNFDKLDDSYTLSIPYNSLGQYGNRDYDPHDVSDAWTPQKFHRINSPAYWMQDHVPTDTNGDGVNDSYTIFYNYDWTHLLEAVPFNENTNEGLYRRYASRALLRPKPQHQGENSIYAYNYGLSKFIVRLADTLSFGFHCPPQWSQSTGYSESLSRNYLMTRRKAILDYMDAATIDPSLLDSNGNIPVYRYRLIVGPRRNFGGGIRVKNLTLDSGTDDFENPPVTTHYDYVLAAEKVDLPDYVQDIAEVYYSGYSSGVTPSLPRDTDELQWGFNAENPYLSRLNPEEAYYHEDYYLEYYMGEPGMNPDKVLDESAGLELDGVIEPDLPVQFRMKYMDHALSFDRPSPGITYSRVLVYNPSTKPDEGERFSDRINNTNWTWTTNGYTAYEFYTARDYPFEVGSQGEDLKDVFEDQSASFVNKSAIYGQVKSVTQYEEYFGTGIGRGIKPVMQTRNNYVFSTEVHENGGIYTGSRTVNETDHALGSVNDRFSFLNYDIEKEFSELEKVIEVEQVYENVFDHGQEIVEYFYGSRQSSCLTGMFTKKSIDFGWDAISGKTIASATKADTSTVILKVTEPAYWTYGDMKEKNMLTQEAFNSTSKVEKSIESVELMFDQNYEMISELLANGVIDHDAKVIVWSNGFDIAGDNSNDPDNSNFWLIDDEYEFIGEPEDFDLSYFNNHVGENIDYISDQGKIIWSRTSNATKYNRYAKPLESKDITGEYNAMIYDWRDINPVCLAKEAKYDQIMYYGFESEEDDLYFERNENTSNVDDNILPKAGDGFGGPYYGTETPYCNDGYGGYNYIAAPADNSVSGGYKVTGWRKVMQNGEFSGEWVFFSQQISSGQNLSFSDLNTNSEYILDEVRIHPANARLTTYTYDRKSMKLTSITDVNNITMYFEYDNNGRLTGVRDQDRNYLKSSEYPVSDRN